MQHDEELLRCAKNKLRCFDRDGNYIENWNLRNTNVERVHFSRYYYNGFTEIMHMHLFEDGGVVISDNKNNVVFHSF